MKIVFFGTSEFAAPSLKKLAQADYEIAAVVTQPDKPAGRKQESLPSSVKLTAQELGLKVLQPEKLTTISDQLKADMFIVASYGKIIPQAILDIPKLGTLNVHPSLLPKYRGPSPIQAAILNGDKQTGVTIIELDQQMDHGPMVAFSEKRAVSRKNYKELHDELAEDGAELLIKILPDYISGKIKQKQQDHSQATFTKIISKEDARIDWSKSAEEIDSMIRAYSDWPVAWTTLNEKRLKIYKSQPVIPAEAGIHSPLIAGQARDDKGKLFVSTGSGRLEILSLQPEGSKRMSARDFINGYTGLSGKILV